MASSEDARAAARRIVEEVLAGHGGSADAATGGPGGTGGARGTVHDLIDEAADELAATDGPVTTGHAPAGGAGDEPVSEARARARALVAEVLAAHDTPDGPPPPPPVATTAPPPRPARAQDPPVAEEPADRTVSTARLRARELVAAALAEADARAAEEAAVAEDARREAEQRRREAGERARLEAEERERAAARAAEEARLEAERRAEEDRREAERREAELRAEAERRAAEERRRLEAAELERSRREDADRALWADVDRDRAATTVRLDRQEERPPEETAPLTVAELAAATATASGPEATAAVDDPAATQAMPRVEATRAPERRAGVPLHEPTATIEPPARPRAARVAVEEDVVTEHGVLEATVGLDDVDETPRTGRWLLVSIVGAIILAIVFPLAIQALVRLVSLS